MSQSGACPRCGESVAIATPSPTFAICPACGQREASPGVVAAVGLSLLGLLVVTVAVGTIRLFLSRHRASSLSE